MKQATFFEGVALGFLASLVGSSGYSTLISIFQVDFSLRILVALLSFAYLLYLISRSRERTGRISTVTVWLVTAALAWFLPLPWPIYVLLHLGLIWLVRTLYFHAGFLAALADLGLLALGGLAALWALSQSNSLFLALWCFFLVQALFVVIPKQFYPRSNVQSHSEDSQNTFQHAYRNAQAAVRKLSSR